MRTAVVTGGGRGIGRAIAMALGGRGTTVVVTGRTRRDLLSACREISARGGKAHAVTMDVSNAKSVSRGMAQVRKAVDRIDVLVNNAGIGGGERVAGSSVARWKATIDTNLVGMYLVSREAVPLMRTGGRIVNLSSVLGRFGVPGYTAYCASKHGVLGFTRALALELADQKVTVNALCPGWVDTEMAAEGMRQGAEENGWSFEKFRERALANVPLKRIIQPEEVAGLVQFLASPGASAITGQTYNICGGQTMD
ncbi:MAG: SDR family NAD(P)-dependent oxidoreductase [Vicinamibacterales bacterium]